MVETQADRHQRRLKGGEGANAYKAKCGNGETQGGPSGVVGKERRNPNLQLERKLEEGKAKGHETAAGEGKPPTFFIGYGRQLRMLQIVASLCDASRSCHDDDKEWVEAQRVLLGNHARAGDEVVTKYGA